MTCEILVTTPDGQLSAGTISWDGKTLVSAPTHGHEAALQNIINEIEYCPSSDEDSVTAEKDPARWLTNLPEALSGSYVRAKLL